MRREGAFDYRLLRSVSYIPNKNEAKKFLWYNSGLMAGGCFVYYRQLIRHAVQPLLLPSVFPRHRVDMGGRCEPVFFRFSSSRGTFGRSGIFLEGGEIICPACDGLGESNRGGTRPLLWFSNLRAYAPSDKIGYTE